MKVIVTGAAGFIGSHVAERLAGRGDTVVGIDNFDAYYDPAIKEQNAAEATDAGVTAIHRLDLATDPLDEALEGADAIVHLAAQRRNDAEPGHDNSSLHSFAQVRLRGR